MPTRAVIGNLLSKLGNAYDTDECDELARRDADTVEHASENSSKISDGFLASQLWVYAAIKDKIRSENINKDMIGTYNQHSKMITDALSNDASLTTLAKLGLCVDMLSLPEIFSGSIGSESSDPERLALLAFKAAVPIKTVIDRLLHDLGDVYELEEPIDKLLERDFDTMNL